MGANKGYIFHPICKILNVKCASHLTQFQNSKLLIWISEYFSADKIWWRIRL